MDEKLKSIIQQFGKELESWLKEPGQASATIEQIRAQLGELKGQLRGQGLRDMVKGLDEAEKASRRDRQHEAAVAIANACKPLGVVLEPKAPPKRQKRRQDPRS